MKLIDPDFFKLIPKDDYRNGFYILMIGHLLLILIMPTIKSILSLVGLSQYPLFSFLTNLSQIGFIQVLYIAPLFYYLQRKKQIKSIIGMMIFAGPTLLISVLCSGSSFI